MDDTIVLKGRFNKFQFKKKKNNNRTDKRQQTNQKPKTKETKAKHMANNQK